MTRLTRQILSHLPSQPPLREDQVLSGLSEHVLVRWTKGGVPHIEAANATDLFFVQGWLCASERLYQMELARRTARGELAEIFGRSSTDLIVIDGLAPGRSPVELDVFLRRLQLTGAAQAGLDSMSPDARALVDAYGAGVNAWLEEGRRPVEFELLSLHPKRWTAEDSACIWKLNALQTSTAWRGGLAAEAIRSCFIDSPAKARALLPNLVDTTDTLLPAWNASGAFVDGVSALDRPSGPGIGGSNAWAVSGTRSSTGRALLCGDLHLPFRAPAQGWLVHLTGGGFDVAGWSIPGVPGVVVGHNDHLAWSVTTAKTMDAQWALERLSPDGQSVKTATGWAPLDSEEAIVHVRSEREPVRTRLRHSPNGPLIESALVPWAPEGHALALRWTGHLPTADLEAILDLDRATDEESLARAISRLGTPALNVVWAHKNGNVGWRLAGALPRFKARPRPGAVPGWTPQDEWDGVASPEDVPALSSPDTGVVVSANQKLFPEGGPLHLGDFFDAPYRARRIRERLDALPRPTLDEAMRIQFDQQSGFGLRFRDGFLSRFDVRQKSIPSEAQEAVLRTALAWDGDATSTSAGAAATWALLTALSETLLRPALGDALYSIVSRQGDLILEPLIKILEANGAPFASEAELDALTLDALTRAADRLARTCGNTPSSWRLGALQIGKFHHPSSERPALGVFFRVASFESGGDPSTIARTLTRLDESAEISLGPVFRHGVEAGDWDGYRVCLASGQSGDPTSFRYRDHFERFEHGEHFVLPFSEEAVAKATEYRARLVKP